VKNLFLLHATKKAKMSFKPVGYTRFVPPAPPAEIPDDDDYELLDGFLDDLIQASTEGPLLLCDGPKCTPTAYRSVSEFVYKRLEEAGSAYAELVATHRNGGVKKTKKAVAAETVETNAPVSAREREDMIRWAEEGELYHLLGIQKIGLAATESDIRNAFRKQQLRFHPDKASGNVGGIRREGDEEQDNKVYLALKKAEEHCLDPVRRRAFDSHFDFDEKIPTGKEKEKNFFDLFGPVFARNARFSNIQPVPVLGTPEDDDATVKAFYKFWFSFDSWRDFTKMSKKKPEDAMDREERRQIERENKAEAANLKKIDIRRVATLVETAYAKDPRVKLIAVREEEAKKAEKLAKNAGKIAAEAEAARVKAEAEKLKADAEAAEKSSARDAKFLKDKEKKHLSRARAALRKLGSPLPAGELGDPWSSTEVNIEYLFTRLDAPAVIALHRAVCGDAAAEVVAAQAVADAEKERAKANKGAAAAASSSSGPAASPSSSESTAAATPVLNIPILLAAIKREREADPSFKPPAAAAAAQVAAVTEEAPPKKETRAWSEEELGKLAKLCAKYPGGTQRRWQLIAESFNKDITPSQTRSLGECTSKAQEL